MDDDVIPRRQGQRGNGRVKAVIQEDGKDDWVMVPGRSNDMAIESFKAGDEWSRDIIVSKPPHPVFPF